jgi:hypothetical protein
VFGGQWGEICPAQGVDLVHWSSTKS